MQKLTSTPMKLGERLAAMIEPYKRTTTTIIHRAPVHFANAKSCACYARNEPTRDRRSASLQHAYDPGTPPRGLRSFRRAHPSRCGPSVSET
jgi:hypothetical protein